MAENVTFTFLYQKIIIAYRFMVWNVAEPPSGNVMCIKVHQRYSGRKISLIKFYFSQQNFSSVQFFAMCALGKWTPHALRARGVPDSSIRMMVAYPIFAFFLNEKCDKDRGAENSWKFIFWFFVNNFFEFGALGNFWRALRARGRSVGAVVKSIALECAAPF